MNLFFITSVILFSSVIMYFTFFHNPNKKEPQLNKFRIVKYHEHLYCIQQQNKNLDWYFIRNPITVENAITDNLQRDLEIKDTRCFMNYNESKINLLILQENWKKHGVVIKD